MKEIIERVVKETVDTSGMPYYRNPLFGYADAVDPIFSRLKEAVGPGHLLPRDLLPEARTVFAFFLPFQKRILENNRSGETASREWAEVYIATNRLIAEITAELKNTMAKEGVRLESQPPTYVFDRKLLIANWSHRHIAYACGLGTFGRNNLLITRKGCGGRFGSAVLDILLEPSPRPDEIHHCFHQSRRCSYCLQICPVRAITPAEFHRQACYAQCLKNDRYFNDLETSDVCGKCAAGPCGYLD